MTIKELIHRVNWVPAELSPEPLNFRRAVFVAAGSEEEGNKLSIYQAQLADEGYETVIVSHATEITPLLTSDTIVVHIPHAAREKSSIYDTVTRSCTSLIAVAQILYHHSQANRNMTSKLFWLISRDFGTGDLAYAPLYGLARAMKMEMLESFGGLFHEDQGRFPLSAFKYAQGFDVVRAFQGIAQTASLQPFQDKLDDQRQLQLKGNSTYLVTGGTRGVGLEIATWLGEQGARNILLLSRRGLIPALDTNENNADHERLVSQIAKLKNLGVSVHVLSIDLSKPEAETLLGQAIDELDVPPIRGVVHAAGIAGYHTLHCCSPSDVADVLAPKVRGSLALDALFPPGTLDFFVLISSVGQLVGFPGQLSYAPANAFLDGLAAYRRRHGDNSMSILWTCWRGIGLMAQNKSATRMLTKGMRARGIMDVSKCEALDAFSRILSLETDHVAVVRVLKLEADEPVRHPVLKDITPRKQAMQSTATAYKSYPEHAVAVVGLACRTAAGDTVDDLWKIIETGRSMAREIDLARFPEVVSDGKMWGNFMADIESFDHQFFKKSKREAAALDPHQRVLLETTYHALESAGCFGGNQQQEAETHDKSRGSEVTGCFIGMNAPDYPLNLACHPASPYTGFGMLRSFVAGRLSHSFGWTGPSQTIDTACSSAMVAIHQACRAIQAGECTRAVAGGINLITNMVLHNAMRVGGFLNETGACKTFDARADGYCRGEAVGVVVLKPLGKALNDGDSIHGVILATGNNQNINSTSITNPAIESQMALYKDVLDRAGISPKEVSYIEAHGTGTRVGDPIEVEGIRTILGGQDRDSTLYVGAVKPNIGHSEGASGVVSFIKVLLMMKYGKIPGQAQFQTLNPNISALEPDMMAISTSVRDWCDSLRLAVVNSYGASGNNAAAVVAPPPPPPPPPTPPLPPSSIPSISAWPFFISAASKASLSAYCRKLQIQIQQGSLLPETSSHLAFALATKQNRKLQHTFCTTATSLDDLQTQLSEPERHITSQGPKPIVLLFSGQNGDTIPSAKPLYDSSLLFRTHLHRCEEVMQSLGLPSLFPAVLQGNEGDGDLILRHATMFAIQYACGKSWIDSGVKPEAICGHSFGEWAALTVSGAITLEGGMRLVTGIYSRAAIIQEVWGDDTGSMIAIEADLVGTDTTPTEHLAPFHKKHPDAKLDIACYNGPNNYVVAGSTAHIDLLESYLNERKSNSEKLRFKVLRGMHAYHSSMADSIVEKSARLSASIPFQVSDGTYLIAPMHSLSNHVPFANSSLTLSSHPTQTPVFPFESCHKQSWTGPGSNVIARNTRGAVYFGPAISRIVNRLGPCTFLEAGFGGPIIAMARNALPQPQTQSQHTFVPINGNKPVQSLANAVVTLWKNGQTSAQFWLFHRSEQSSFMPVELPPYQFEKHSHWLEYTHLAGNRGRKTDEQDLTQYETCSHCLKDIDRFPYISHVKSQTQGRGKSVFKIDMRSRRYQDLVKGHVVVGSPICPAAMYLELASHAVALLHKDHRVSNIPEIVADAVKIKAPLGLDMQRSVTLTLTENSQGMWDFELFSTKNSKSISHATGSIALRNSSISSVHEEQDKKDKWARITELLETDTNTEALRGTMVYKVFRKMAIYSAAYQGLRYLVGKGTEGAGDITVPVGDVNAIARAPNDGISDPAVVDTFLQVPGAFIHSLRATDEIEAGDTSYICTGIDAVGPLNGLRASGKYRVYTKIVREDNREAVLDVFSFDTQTGSIIWSAKGLKFSKVPRSSLAKVLAGANPGMEFTNPVGSSNPATQSFSPKIPYQVASAAHREKFSKNEKRSASVLSEVQTVLSHSLDVPVEEITNQALLEELGVDSLVGSEVLANLRNRFKIQISSEDLTTAKKVACLCELISSRVDGDTSSDIDSEDQDPDPMYKTADDGTPMWQKTVFQILGQSLDIPTIDIQMDSKLEDLGADSLVASEIISNLNNALGLDISPTEFSSMADVASLCEYIADSGGDSLVQTPTTSLSSLSNTHCTSRDDLSRALVAAAAAPIESKKSTIAKGHTVSIHMAFQQIRSSFDTYANNTKFTGFWDRVYPQQLGTVTAFIMEAFEKLGCPIRDFSPGKKLPNLQGTLPKYRRETLRLWEILEQVGVVEKAGDHFIRGPVFLGGGASDRSGLELITELISNFPQYASTHGLLGLLGPHLAECLTGKSDPVPLLFGSDKGRGLLDDFYANAPDLLAATNLLCDFMSAAIHCKASNGEPFHVLEVGGGTGGTTKHLIPVLQATGLPFKYTFTELSVSLLARAKKTTFKGIAGVEFRKLNIEDDPPEDLLGRYHIVVSSNCVHATRNLRNSLVNMRKLVRPDDGCVALVELTQKLAWYDLVWGLLDGWWLFDDGRKYALQSPWAWERVMLDAGFAHVDWSESASHESRSVRVICGTVAEPERACPAKATSMLLHRPTFDSGDRSLFLIPDGFGSGAVFDALAPLLSPVEHVSVYTLSSPFLKRKPDSNQVPTIEELAAIYVTEIKRRKPEGPYMIGGYSVGGVLAFEAARQLLEDGNEVKKMFLIDTACPTFARFMPDALVDFLDSINRFSMMDDETPENKRGSPLASDHFTLARQQLLRYRVSTLPGQKIPQVVLFSAREGVNKQDEVPLPKVLPMEQQLVNWFLNDRADDELFEWDKVVDNVIVIPTDGNHFSMMRSPLIAPQSYSTLLNTIQSPTPTIVDFTAGWTGPCRPMFSAFEQISHATPHMAFYRMDVRKLSDEEIAKLGIVAMPTFMVFREGRKVKDLVGGSPGGLEGFVLEGH
ncbi:polyketide synthase [Aspergillus bombycis]|uniref:Polyketide synthase n=2 Tax=Aspergillus TaxID=5052 RepID=A0A1F8AC94_9EURO|nr:polyketide synthase [Aspergillus bombycis]OGM49360.1 polyketide synthase [Aspergillus bombycis]